MVPSCLRDSLRLHTAGGEEIFLQVISYPHIDTHKKWILLTEETVIDPSFRNPGTNHF